MTAQHIAPRPGPSLAVVTPHTPFTLPSAGTYRVVITPTMAAEIMTNPSYRGPNRRLNKLIVGRLSAALTAGEWRFNGEAIKFGADGSLQDGQHRLTACIESDIPFETLLVTGLPPEVQDTMDLGRTRTATDVLSIHGYTGRVTNVAAAARILIAYSEGSLNTSGHNPEIRNQQILAYCDAHPDIEWATNHIGHPTKLPLRASVLVAGYVLMHRKDPNAAEEFLTAFIWGADLVKGNPILTLRERMASAAMKREKLNAYIELSALLRAWNAWRAGTAMSRFLFLGQTGVIPVPTVLR